jgi:hypothetical protein
VGLKPVSLNENAKIVRRTGIGDTFTFYLIGKYLGSTAKSGTEVLVLRPGFSKRNRKAQWNAMELYCEKYSGHPDKIKGRTGRR